MVYKESSEVIKKVIFYIKDWFGDFYIGEGGNSEMVTSLSRLLLINVMERDEGGYGDQKHEFWRDVIIECFLYTCKTLYQTLPNNTMSSNILSKAQHFK